MTNFLDSDDDDSEILDILKKLEENPVNQCFQPKTNTRIASNNQNINYRVANEISNNLEKSQYKTKIMIRTDILEPQYIYFAHSTAAESIYKNNGGVQAFISSKPYWKIPLKNYRRTIAALKSTSNSFIPTFDVPPDPVVNAMCNFKPKPVSSSLFKNIPEKLQNALYPHQKESIFFAASHSFRVFLADDMGLGKTIEAVAIACAAGFPKTCRAIVLAPNHLVNNWTNAFLKWTNIFQSQINVLIRSEKITSTPLVIISYSLCSRKSVEIMGLDYDIVIADECHEFKNSKTQLFQKVSPIINKAKYLILLSGTPMVKPSELYPQLKLLLPRVFNSFIDFGTRYCHGEMKQGYFDAHGCTHPDELRVVLEHLVMLRRQKDEVLADLPVKKRYHIMLQYTPSPEMREQIEKMRVNRISLVSGMETMKPEQNTIMTTAFSLNGKDKLPSVLDWFCCSEFRRVFFHEQRKCLIFAYHRNVIDGIYQWMIEQGVKCISITGSTPKDQRELLFNQFKTDPETKIAVLSIEISATGITLTEASLVIFAEFKWAPADHLQAEDRVHRIGQKRDVEIFYLHAPGSLDDRIWEIISKKLLVISTVISSKTKNLETDINA